MDKPFTVSVDAAFTEDGVWLIDARIIWRDGLPAEGSRLLGEGRSAMLAAIAREGHRGRLLGAMKVQVRTDTGNRVRDIGLMEIIPDPDTLH